MYKFLEEINLIFEMVKGESKKKEEKKQKIEIKFLTRNMLFVQVCAVMLPPS